MRLIDADAIDYDEYWNRNGEGFTIDVCQKAQRIIDEQPTIPSAEAVQGWIPCSERLPERGFGLHYLVTLKDGYDFMDDVYEAFFDKYGWHVGDNELAYDDIIAWMPLPKPYKGGEDDNA